MMPTQDVFIGLDLAWSRRNPSGGAVIAGNQVVDWRADLTDDASIIAYVGQWLTTGGAAVVAVDAPLRVPNQEGARACDRALSADWSRFRAGAHPANRDRLATDGDIRGETLVAHLSAAYGFHEQAPLSAVAGARVVCEVYPHPAHVSLFGLQERLRYKAKAGWGIEARWAAFSEYQGHLASLGYAEPPLLGAESLTGHPVTGLRGRALKQLEDALDALTCAYVASYAWRHGPAAQIVYGSVGEGHILVPRRMDGDA
jgi:predicted RNase H-like nuclease